MKLRAILLLSAFALAACETAPNDSDESIVGDTGNFDGYQIGTGLDSVSSGSQGDLEQNVGDRVFFDTNSSTLSSAAQETLQRQTKWLNQYDSVDIVIEGHADERGTREYNLALGERRANAVRDYLVSLGVNADRLRVVSYGKERPAVWRNSRTASVT